MLFKFWYQKILIIVNILLWKILEYVTMNWLRC